MLGIIRRGQRWVTALFVIAVGGVFIFFMGWGGPRRGPSGGAVIEVGPYRFGIREFERARAEREQQAEAALGDQFDPKTMRDMLDQATAQTLTERAILALEAEKLGLTVTNEEIRRDVRAASIFRDQNGRFDPAAYQSWAEYEYGNERNFLNDQRLSRLALKMLRLLHTQARVSEGEAREAVMQSLEQVRITFAVLAPGAPPADLEIGEAEILEFLENREAEARALYDGRADTYDLPERVRARHILLRVEPDASEDEEAEVRAAAANLLQQLREGADFAELAKEVSQDPGSKREGGDLGFFGRGQMVKPVEDAAFTLEPGTLSDLVRSEFGFHIIRVEEHREAEYRTFESVREELARELLEREAAQADARAKAERLAAGVREGRSLEEVARSEGLTLERSGWLPRRTDGYVPKLGSAQELMAVAFTLSPGESSPRIFEVGDRLALVQLLERREEKPEDMEAQIAEQRKKLLEEKRSNRFRTWLGERRLALLKAGDLAVNLDAVRRGG